MTLQEFVSSATTITRAREYVRFSWYLVIVLLLSLIVSPAAVGEENRKEVKDEHL